MPRANPLVPIGFLSSLVFLALGSFLSAQTLPPQPVPFHWSAVDGANGYLVEVGLSGTTVETDKKSADENSATLNLVPGSYLVRVTALDSAQNPLSAAEWTPLQVEAQEAPVLEAMDPLAWIQGTGGVVKLKVSGLALDAKAAVRTPSGTVVPLDLTPSADGNLELTLPPQQEIGNDTLQITNPPAKTLSIRGKLSVHYAAPVVTKVDPSVLEESDTEQTIVITGNGFSPDAIVGFRLGDGGKFNLLTIAASTATSLSVALPAGAKPGDYRLTVANAVRDKPVLAGTVKIKSKPVVAASQDDERQKKRMELQLQIQSLDQAIQKVQGETNVRRILGWISLGLGAAGTATGVWGYTKGTQDYSAFQSASNTADAANSRSQLGTDGMITIVGGSVGLVGLVAAPFLLFGDDAAKLIAQRQNLQTQLQRLGL